jgi:hypothetical protein
VRARIVGKVYIGVCAGVLPYSLTRVFAALWHSISYDPNVLVDWLLEQAIFCVILRRYALHTCAPNQLLHDYNAHVQPVRD